MKVFVTRYWETKGILEAEIVKISSAVWQTVEFCNHVDRSAVVEKTDIFHDMESAVMRVRKLRSAKIAALEKQIEKLRTMEPVEEKGAAKIR